MEHKIKELAEAMTNTHVKHLIQTNVKEVKFEDNHLTIYLDNKGPLNELSEKENDHHLQNGMEKVYGDISYELKLFQGHVPSDKERGIPRNIH